MVGVSLMEGRGQSSRKIVEDAYGDLCEEGKDIHVIQWARNSPRIRMWAPLPLGPLLQRGFARAKKSSLDCELFGGQQLAEMKGKYHTEFTPKFTHIIFKHHRHPGVEAA